MRMLAVFVAAILAAGSTGTATAQLYSEKLEIGGLARHYELYIPQTAKDKLLPLVIALHGRTGTGAEIAELTGFNELAEQKGFAVLYPDGVDGAWNYTVGVPGYPENGPDDVAFLDVLVQKVGREIRVDSERLYVAGFSNGGFMAERLACNAPGRYAALASVSAAGFGGMAETCPGSYPLRILFVHGTADTNIPWDGVTQEFQGRSVPILYSVPQTLEFWANYAGCDADLETTDLSPAHQNPQTDVRFVRFTTCPAGSRVALYAVSGGKHTWPGAASELGTTAAIWAFFSE